MGQNQSSRATKLANKAPKLNRNPLVANNAEKLKAEKTAQLQLILHNESKDEPCTSTPQTHLIIHSAQPCKTRLGRTKDAEPTTSAQRSSCSSCECGGGKTSDQDRNDASAAPSTCPSRNSSSSLSDLRPAPSVSSLQRQKGKFKDLSPPSVPNKKQRKAISEAESSPQRPEPISESAISSKQPSQQSKRKRKQRKTLKSLKLRRGSNSSLVSRRRSSRRKREMTQLSKSWLAVSNNLEQLGMDMFRRVADLCPDITRTISGLPEGAQISPHILLSHPRARQHARRVMETVGMVVDSYGEFDRVRPLLVMLGRHHAKYGVEERQLMVRYELTWTYGVC
eukprot:scpid61721/ scgid1626/ 